MDTTDSKPSTAEVTYTYTATGAIDQIDYKGNKDADYAYTIRDWVDTINNVGSPSGNFAASYNYTDNGNVDIANFHNPQVQSGGGPATHQWDFGYDGLNRLSEADFGNNGTTGTFDVTGLEYDDAGNITDLQRRDESGGLIDNLTYSYSGSNRLQSVTDAAGQPTSWDAAGANFGYDDNGNLTSQSGKITGITYDHRNLPGHFDLSNGSDVYGFYNGDGQRVLKESSGGSWTFYVMDGPQTLAVIDQNGFSHFNLVGNSTFGRWEPGGTRRYYITDHLGSTRAVIDNNGNVLETFDYYPFGLLMPKRNTAGANTLEKFTGKERDTEGNLNLDYFGARYYDPAIGRWHNPDPLADDYPGWSPYNYVLNNPLSNADPDGREVECKTREDCEQAADELNKAHEGETNITVEEYEKQVTEKAWWDIGGIFGTKETKTVTAYRLSTAESDFDFSQNKFTSGLYDVINSEEITFNLDMVPGDQLLTKGVIEMTAHYQQGKNDSYPGGGNVYVSADGNRLNEPIGVVLMHELVGHGHPAGGSNAHDINRFYRAKLGYKLAEPRGMSHPGYHKVIGWKRTNLYEKNK